MFSSSHSPLSYHQGERSHEKLDERQSISRFLSWLGKREHHPDNHILLFTQRYNEVPKYTDLSKVDVNTYSLHQLVSYKYSQWVTQEYKADICYQLIDSDVADYVDRLHFTVDLCDPQARLLKTYKLNPLKTDKVSDCLSQLKELIQKDPPPPGSLLQWVGRRLKQTDPPNQQEPPSDRPEFVEVTTWEAFQQTNTDQYEDVFCPLDIQSHPIRFVKFPHTTVGINSFIIPETDGSDMLCEPAIYCRAEVCIFCTLSIITTLSVCSVFLFAATGTN